MKKRIVSLVMVLALLLALVPTGALAAGGTVHQASSQDEFEAALEAAHPGDTIQLTGSVYVVNPLSNNAPLIIDKQVTITGSELINGYGGILLGADVTFQNITLKFSNRSCNVIAANGHTLTLNNVAWNDQAQKIHLFCGGMTGEQYGAAEGSHGRVVICGSTSLGNIYAGSISRDGEKNSFDKPATITIRAGTTGKMGQIYACGALETYVEDDWFGLEQVDPPLASASWFPVTGQVDISLYQRVVSNVDGQTGGSRCADVKFAGGQNNISNLLLKNISGLSMLSGDLTPSAGSSFGDALGTVSAPDGTKLDLSDFQGNDVDGNVSIANFYGGGTLVLGQSRALAVSGEVTGSTVFGAGSIFGGASEALIDGHTYIVAPGSDENSFVLAPNSPASVALQYNSQDGSWRGAASGEAADRVIVESFGMSPSVALPSDSERTEIPFDPIYAGDSAELSCMDFLPLTITVNGSDAVRTEDGGYYTYTAQGLKLEVIDDNLYLESQGGGAIGDGRYDITVSIPAGYTAANRLLQSSTVLSVGDIPDTPVVSAISIESTTHKTSYLTGEALDVSGLTLLVTMSDGSTCTVGATEDMVSGFDSSVPAESQTLTVTYEGKTAFYTVSIAAPAPRLYTVTVSGSYAEQTGAGSYGAGSTVSVSAGVRQGYTFGGWHASGMALASPNSAEVSFIMPAHDVSLTASWTAESGGAGGGSGSGGSSGSVSQPVSTVGSGAGAVTTASPAVMATGGTASVDVSDEMAAEIVRQAAGGSRIVISPKITGETVKTEVKLTSTAMREIGGKTASTFTIDTPGAKVTFPRSGVKDLAGGALTVSVERHGDAVKLSVTVGGRQVGDLSGGIALEVPYSRCGSGTVAVLVGTDGSRRVVRKSLADDTENTVFVPLSGSAQLEIVDNSRSFEDMPNASWAKNAVLFASAHELFNGTSATRFTPNGPMTRGMLATVLHNMESNPAQSFNGSFGDVAAGAWYEKAVFWAAGKGIVYGYGNGLFGTNDNITREQLAAMLYRYAGSPSTTGELSSFLDSGKASDYAVPALRWAVEQGILTGRGGGILDPTGTASRVETASMLMRYCKKMNEIRIYAK